jgi:hypothetical protein
MQSVCSWYEARDVLLNDNCWWHRLRRVSFLDTSGGVVCALDLARACDHPDAVWLSQVLRDVQTRASASKVFLSLPDVRAVAFAAILAVDGRTDVPMLRRAAEAGYAYAQARMSRHTSGEGNCVICLFWFHVSLFLERLSWARKAAAQGERDGYFYCGICLEEGEGCETDLESAKENYLLAAKLGHVHAMRY